MACMLVRTPEALFCLADMRLGQVSQADNQTNSCTHLVVVLFQKDQVIECYCRTKRFWRITASTGLSEAPYKYPDEAHPKHLF